MKALLSKSLLLLFLFGALSIGSYKMNNYLIVRYGFALKDTTEILITGSSLVTLGLDPEHIPKSENIGLAAEPIVISFFKLRDILPDKHASLRKVVISCSLQELPNQDKVFNSNKPMVVEMFTRLSFLKKMITLQDLKQFDVDYFSYLEVYIRNRIFPNYAFFSRWMKQDKKNCDIESLLHIGGFQKNSSFNQRQVGRRRMDPKRYVSKYFPEDRRDEKISPVNYQYLDSIARLCQERNIELVAVGMPVSKELYEEIPESYRNYYKEKMKDLASLPHCRYINLTHTAENDWFSDLIHLNEKGALQISLVIKRELNKAL
ncbi:MAG: SGNH/GDSL hydrolase family protein [Marinilabiliaceae bacterium]|nr:SGNH/GDSL hydrolase family protein [Marinilabiliaceae bacterium]